MVRDDFRADVAELVIDDERQYHRILAYVRRTSPELAERVKLYKGKRPLFQRYEIEQGIRSTLSRRVPLPSGGSLVFDYGEAFTVVDVNTGRFTGTTKKLEDTILKNNLEAAVEVVRQLRLRDIGGIIVVDFIDMASQKNRDAVLEVLQRELKKDRSKVYVVEISPLGLVEMTRKNVADGVREIMTCECPTCEGTGRVLSDESLAIDMLRNLRRVARESKSEAFRVELEDGVARALIGAGGTGLDELEHETGRAFDVVGRLDVPREHFEILAEGTLDEIGAQAPPCAAGRRAQAARSSSRTASSRPTPCRGSAPATRCRSSAGCRTWARTQRLRIERATRFAAQAALLDVEPCARRRRARRGRAADDSDGDVVDRSPTSSSRSAASASASTSRVACAGRSAARPPSSAASAAARAAAAAAAAEERRRARRRQEGRGRPRRSESDGAADGEATSRARPKTARQRPSAAAGAVAAVAAGRGGSGSGNGARTPARTEAAEVVANGAPAEPAVAAAAVSDRPPREPGAARPRQQQRRRAQRQRQRRRRRSQRRSARESASPHRPHPAARAPRRSRPPSERRRPAMPAAASEDERRKGLISRILKR